MRGVWVGTSSRRNKEGTNGKPHTHHGQPLLDAVTSPAQPEWNEYHVADARNLRKILGGKPVIDVTVTSPPYWDVKNYGTSDQIGYKQSLDSYLNDLISVFSEIWRCTKPEGSLWIVMKSVKKDGHLHLLPFLLSQRLTKLSSQAWYLQDVLVWHKTHTLPWSHRQKLTDNYEHILCFSKSKDFSLNLDAIRSTEGITNWWVKYPERYHPYGKALSNVWEIAIPTQGSWGNGHFAHSCPLPVELIKRIILLSTGKAGTVLDPFAGSGSTALAASSLGRNWLAVDVNHKYRDMFHRRLAHETGGEAKGPVRSESKIAQTNLALRQLKYGILIYKRIAPGLKLTASDVPLILIISGQTQKSAKPHWIKDICIRIVLSDDCYRRFSTEIASEIEEHRAKPPLSKFQLDATVEVISKSRLLDDESIAKLRKLHIYPRGEFWRSASVARPAELCTIDPLGKLPTLVSDILVQEQPAF